MFLDLDDLKTAIYQYQAELLTEGDHTIIAMAIAAAESEVASYLSNNYDVKAVFNKAGAERHPLLLQVVKTIAKYHLIELSNAEVLYDQAKERYDRSIAYLVQINKGAVRLDLPPLKPGEDTGANTGTGDTAYGSRKKFNHE